MNPVRIPKKPLGAFPKIRVDRDRGEFRLVDRTDTWGGVVGLFFLALFWNGITWLAILSQWKAWGIFGQIFFALFFALFVLVGLVLIYAVIHQAMIVWRLESGELFLPRWPLRMGESVRIRFRRRLKRTTDVVRIEGALICNEIAVFSVGTDTRTVEEELRRIPLPPRERPLSGRTIEGEWEIRIHPDLPPSLALPHSRVEWTVELKITMHPLSDDSKFQLLVLPEYAP